MKKTMCMTTLFALICFAGQAFGQMNKPLQVVGVRDVPTVKQLELKEIREVIKNHTALMTAICDPDENTTTQVGKFNAAKRILKEHVNMAKMIAGKIRKSNLSKRTKQSLYTKLNREHSKIMQFFAKNWKIPNYQWDLLTEIVSADGKVNIIVFIRTE